MKQRRKLEKGDKIVYLSFTGEQVPATVKYQHFNAVHIDNDIEPIHRFQVVKTYRKKRPQIVWTNASGVRLLSEGDFAHFYPEKTWLHSRELATRTTSEIVGSFCAARS